MKYTYALLMLLLIGCASHPDLNLSPAAKKAESSVLDLKAASLRSKQISDVKYKISLNLDDKKPQFEGTSEIAFDFKNSTEPLRVDFEGGTIHKITLNQRPLTQFKYNQFFITIPAEQLNMGRNQLVIEYSHPYSNSGTGLQRSVDPEDKRVYLYTDFEPNDANKVFPCFDQPDLKATYIISAEAPSAWTVISAMPEEKVERVNKYLKRWQFPETKRFSTYLISLHAGPYHVWKSKADKIPLRLFARRSLAKYVHYKEWLEITRKGMEFYQDYFHFAYPFTKYDQVIVPDFISGAMENVAAVTFSERYITRGKPTTDDREDLALTILHEMAHMWFGNIVTMKWWNDLWLNESFATYLSTLAEIKTTPFKSPWLEFYQDSKNWAYAEDQMVTTHPIVTPVETTEQAFQNFDGITYGKGASVLKQLAFLIGDNSFRNGIRDYIQTNQFSNATLADFMTSLQKNSSLNLNSWQGQWFESSGVNMLSATPICKDGKLESISLTQEKDISSGLIRLHKTQMAILDNDKTENLIVQRFIQVTYEAEKKISELSGRPCPKAVFANYEDQDYVKLDLDSKTQDTIVAQIGRTKDPFLRIMFWGTLWQLVKDAKFSVVDYFNLALKNLGKEKDLKNLRFVLRTITHPHRPSVIGYLPQSSLEEISLKNKLFLKLETLAWSQVKSAPSNSDLQKTWFDTHTSIVASAGGVALLEQLLNKKTKVPGNMELDQDRRWELVYRLRELNTKNSLELLKKEVKRDPSHEGKNQALAAEVAVPDPTVKQTWMKTLTSKDSKLSFSESRTIMTSLFPPSQTALKLEIKNQYFGALKDISQNNEAKFQVYFASMMAPTTCSQETSIEMNRYLKENPDLATIPLKQLRIALQENERCGRIQELARTSLKRAAL